MREVRGLTPRQQALKRAFDLVLGGCGLLATSPVLVVGVVAATVSTREWGVFSQERIGRNGVPFRVHKVRSMRRIDGVTTTITAGTDPRITRTGAWLRRLKIDELPQLVNVVRGDMSLVGPRPDVAGWADELTGEDRIVLSVRPGITGPASVAYRHEEELLTAAEDPEVYNREVIWPDKVRLNREYVENWSLASDLAWIAATVRTVLERD
ncbi:sugar transferase [Janibacter corallicola]|uniref:sugar transferase n=1 Tax=Janibacter corallicola TaxID=415212 RepID=UPI0009FFB036|nr:sugar transferase [Janibacter corallicola]